MTFTVTYRDKTGAKREEAIEAESRDAVFAAMRARGISPLSIREGGHAGRVPLPGGNCGARGGFVETALPDGGKFNGTKALKALQKPNAEKSHTSPLFRNLSILVILAILGGGAWWWFGGHAGRVPIPGEVTSKPKTIPIKIAPTPPPETTSAKPAGDTPTQLPLNVKRDHSELTREELLTKVPHWAYTVEDRKRIDPGYAKRHERFLERKARNPWKTYADNALATLLFSDSSMMFMPPFNTTFNNAFLKSLETPIIVSPDDPPELQAQKRELMETKVWLKDQMDGGKDIVEILNEEYNRRKKINGLRESLLRELNDIQRKATSVQELEDFVSAANVMLKEVGDNNKFNFPTIMTKLRLKREAAKKGE